jgi:uncharacterized protein YggU (UPF0235/DUF167 family)
MVDRDTHLHSGRTGSAITVQVSVGAAKTEISEVLEDGTLKIRLAVPRAGKQADDMLIDFLARVFSATPDKIEIVAGLSGQDKLITILDLDAVSVQARVYQHVKK